MSNINDEVIRALSSYGNSYNDCLVNWLQSLIIAPTDDMSLDDLWNQYFDELGITEGHLNGRKYLFYSANLVEEVLTLSDAALAYWRSK